MSEAIRIVAAVVDKLQLTMYREDGTSIIVPQGDPRIRVLTDKVVPAIDQEGFCLLDQKDLAVANHYEDAETSMNGFIKFFRMIKQEAEKLLSQFAEPVEPTGLVGEIPDAAKQGQEHTAPVKQTRSMAAVSEIVANAQPASKFHEEEPSGRETTVIGVLADGTVIPGIEQMDVQVQALASKVGSATAMTNFFKRLSSVVHAHSVQDLLKFMEKGELPVAEDGTVLVYKRLKRTKEAGVFVDCHTSTVKQRVGSYVCMDKALVDPNRSNECSNGLHVARRDYLSSFSGDVCVLAKLAPEDVIAVPHGDARKLRARAYHIIAELSQEDHNRVVNNKPLVDSNLLGNAIAGNHVGILEQVQIVDQKRTKDSVVITQVANIDTPAVEMDKSLSASSLDELPTQSKEKATVDARKVATDRAANTKGRTTKDLLLENWSKAKTNVEHQAAAEALVAFKKTSKKSWGSLGIGAAQSVVIEAAAVAPTEEVFTAPPGGKAAKVKPVSKVKAKPVPAPKATKAKANIASAKGSVAAQPAIKKAVKALPKGKPKNDEAMIKKSLPERALQLMYNVIDGNKQSAKDLLALKKTSKKSWDYLGISDSQLKQVNALAEV